MILVIQILKLFYSPNSTSNNFNENIISKETGPVENKDVKKKINLLIKVYLNVEF